MMIPWPVQVTESKFSRWYDKLILKAQARTKPAGYTECHHVIPRSFGGNDLPKNLVHLTAREHFVAHLLLWAMNFPGKHGHKMLHAVSMMTKMSRHSMNDGINSRTYEKIRIAYNLATTGEGNPFYGKTHTAESMEKMMKYHRDPLIRRKRSQRVTGDLNPAKNPGVGKKISQSQKDRMFKDKINGTGSYSESYKQKQSLAQSGGNNGRANTYIFTDVFGATYTVKGNAKHFCNEHYISMAWVYAYLQGKDVPSNCLGWTVSVVGEPRLAINNKDSQKYILKSELPSYLEAGWLVGPKPRKNKKSLTPEQLQLAHEKRLATLLKKKEAGWVNPMKGRLLPPEQVAERRSRPGRPHSEETKMKLSIQRKGRPGLKGEQNPMYGKNGPLNPGYGIPRSEEVKRKIAETRRRNHAAKKGLTSANI